MAAFWQEPDAVVQRFHYNRSGLHRDSFQDGNSLIRMPLTYQPFSQVREIDEMRRTFWRNVSREERKWSLLGGVAMIALGLAQSGSARALGLLAGGALLYRGSTGHCPMYRALGINPRGVSDRPGVHDQAGHKIVRSVAIQRPRAEIFAYWRNLENLSDVMSHVKSVQVHDARRSHWIVRGPGGSVLEWDAEIINERQDELIAWESLPGSQIPNAGSVWFESRPDGGTRVKVALEFEAPSGELGVLIASLFGEAPERQLEDDLLRLKERLESSIGRSAIL
jgi:uncharacterized membrane protein